LKTTVKTKDNSKSFFFFAIGCIYRFVFQFLTEGQDYFHHMQSNE